MSITTISRRDHVGVHIQAFVDAAERAGTPIHASVVAEWEKAAAIVTRAVERIRYVKAARDYSSEGRMARLDAARDEALKGLEPLRTTIQRHQAQLAEIEKAVRAEATKRPTTPEEIARHREIRDVIRAEYRVAVKDGASVLDVLRIETLHAEALTGGDVVKQRAIEQSDFALVRPAYLEEVHAARLAQHAEYGAIKADLHYHRSIHEAAVQNLKEAIESTTN